MPARIIVLWLILVALPFVLGGGTPPPNVSSVTDSGSVARLPVLPGTLEFWAEGARTLVATAAGAWLAFWFNLRVQARTRLREERAAAVHATTALGAEYRDFLLLRRMWNEEVERCQQQAPKVPRWLVMRPFLHFLSKEHDPDFKALAFMYEGPGGKAMELLNYTHEVHRDLIGHVEKFSELATRKQELIMASPKTEPVISAGAAKLVVGELLAHNIEAELQTLDEHFNHNEPIYLRAADALYQACGKRVGFSGLVRVAKPKPDQIPLSQEPE